MVFKVLLDSALVAVQELVLRTTPTLKWPTHKYLTSCLPLFYRMAPYPTSTSKIKPRLAYLIVWNLCLFPWRSMKLMRIWRTKRRISESSINVADRSRSKKELGRAVSILLHWKPVETCRFPMTITISQGHGARLQHKHHQQGALLPGKDWTLGGEEQFQFQFSFGRCTVQSYTSLLRSKFAPR